MVGTIGVRDRGFLLVELAIGVVMLVIIMTVALSADRGQLRHVADSFATTKAGRLASGTIEQLQAMRRDPEVGDTLLSFTTPESDHLPGVRGLRRVRRLEAGLYHVFVEISWVPNGAMRRRRVELTTLLDREAPR